MIAAPAPTRRRGLTAAGGHPPRRPGAPGASHAARGLALLTAAAVLTALAAGCASSGPASSGPASGGTAKPAGNVFTTSEQVSLARLRSEISTLYSDHPDIATFSVQDVQYTTGSRDTVLNRCTSGGADAGGAESQDAETGQVIACAPLIFFLYSYGKRASVPAAVTVAGDLYWYAVIHITGPVSARTSLDELLQSWKLPVPGLTPAQSRSAVAASVITAAGDAMLIQKSVRVVVSDTTAGAAHSQRIVADIGAVTGTELITYGTTTATIRITRQAAYFTGDRAGLVAYLGLSAAAAAKAGSRWVEIKAGTSEYQDLAAENTISSLSASVLPSVTDASAAQVSSATIDGQQAYILDWTATDSATSGSSTTSSARLVLSATPRVLPLRETITSAGESKTVTFSRWGAPFTVTAPAPVVPYTQLKN